MSLVKTALLPGFVVLIIRRVKIIVQKKEAELDGLVEGKHFK